MKFSSCHRETIFAPGYAEASNRPTGSFRIDANYLESWDKEIRDERELEVHLANSPDNLQQLFCI
jgi:hypothetical protein